MLEAENVSVELQGKLIVNKFSLSIRSGQVYCLLGPNGAGKTTALRVMAGTLHPKEGTIKIGGFDIHKKPIPAKRLLGYIPDDGWIFKNLTGWQYLTFIGRLRNMNQSLVKKRVTELASDLNVSDMLDKPIVQLSKGSAQKIAMMAGLMHNPQLVIMDEPLTALDPIVVRDFTGDIQRMAERGVTFLIATHLMKFAEQVATHIGIMKKGSIIQQGTVQDIQAQYDATDLDKVFIQALQAGGSR